MERVAPEPSGCRGVSRRAQSFRWSGCQRLGWALDAPWIRVARHDPPGRIPAHTECFGRWRQIESAIRRHEKKRRTHLSRVGGRTTTCEVGGIVFDDARVAEAMVMSNAQRVCTFMRMTVRVAVLHTPEIAPAGHRIIQIARAGRRQLFPDRLLVRVACPEHRCDRCRNSLQREAHSQDQNHRPLQEPQRHATRRQLNKVSWQRPAP